jgi:hypothetical protein
MIRTLDVQHAAIATLISSPPSTYYSHPRLRFAYVYWGPQKGWGVGCAIAVRRV